MTDTYGSNPHDHEAGEHADHEHETNPATEGHDEWASDQPPVDDFADPSSEEAASVSEEAGHDHDHDGGSSEPAKKSSLLLPVVAVVGGLLFLGAILYWQFGSMFQSHAPTSMANMTTTLGRPSLENRIAVTTGAPVPDVAPTTAMTNAAQPAAPLDAGTPASVALPTGMTNNAPMPVSADNSVPSSLAPSAQQAQIPQPSAAAVVPEPAPNPGNTGMMATGNTPLPMPTAAPPVVPMPSGAASAQAPADARLTALTNHVESLQRSIDQASIQMSQIAAMAASSQAAQPVINPALEERLTRIEQQLAQLQHPAPALATPAMAASDAVNSSKMDAAPMQHPKKTKVKSKKVRHVASKSVSRRNAHKATVAKASWVLRAATPDEAWVARDASTPALRPVHVGDDLPGLGKVKGIRQNGDAWVIEGTEGTLR